MKRIILGIILSFSFFISEAAIRTWNGAGVTGGTGSANFNLVSNWSGSGSLAGEDLVITLNNNSTNTVTLSASLNVNSVTITGNVTTVGSGGRAFTLDLGTFTLTVAGAMSVTNSSTPPGVQTTRPFTIITIAGSGSSLLIGGNLTCTNTNSSFSDNGISFQISGIMTVTGSTLVKSLNVSTFANVLFAVGNSPAVITFNGNTTFDDGTSDVDNSVLVGSIGAGNTGTIAFKSNLTLGAVAATNLNFTGGTVLFDGASSQTVTFGNTVSYFTMPNVIIGSSNNPTINLANANSVTPDNISGNMTINGSSVLNIGNLQLNRSSNGGTMLLKNTSQLKLTGTSSVANGGTATLFTGSNFPSGFTTVTLDSTSTVEFNGASQTVPLPSAATVYGNLTLSGTATKTIGGNISLYRALLVGSGLTVPLGTNTITLKSNAQTTAYVTAITGTPFTYGTGGFIVERYISSGRKWRFLSVPTDDAARTVKQSWQEGAVSSASNPVAGYGMQVTDDNIGTWSGNGFDDYSQGGPSVKQWNGSAWTGIATASALIKSASGYMCYVRGDRTALASNATVAATTLRTKGQLYTGSQTPITVASGATVSIGNPYASAIDLRALSNTGIAGGPAFYVWDPKATGSYGLGNYQTLTYNGSNYIVVPGGGSYGASGSVQNYIQSGQAFFVIGGAGGNVTFTEAAKATGSQQVFRTASGEEQIVAANLFLKTGEERVLADGAAAFIDNTYSNNADEDDAAKIAGTSERVSILKNGRQLSVERRQDFTADDTIFLNIGNVKVHEYSWKVNFSHIDLRGGTAFFIDKFLSTSLPLSLSDTNTIDFSIANVPESYAADRFIIVFKPATVLPVAFVSVSALRNNDKVVSVKWNIESELNMVAYNVEYSTDGRSFATVGTKAAAGLRFYSFDHTNASKGNNYYRIKAIENSGRVIYSPIVKVNAINENASVSVYPNPAENKQINISFIKQEKGNYNLQLVNAAGQNVYSTIINISGENQISTLQLKDIATGTYQLVISSEKSKALTQSVFIK